MLIIKDGKIIWGPLIHFIGCPLLFVCLFICFLFFGIQLGDEIVPSPGGYRRMGWRMRRENSTLIIFVILGFLYAAKWKRGRKLCLY